MNNKRNIATWAVSILMAMAIAGAGFAKVSGQEMMIQSFNLFALPDWFRIVIGSLEIIGGILLLVPIMTGTAAFGLSIIMLGAISCHVMFTPLSGGVPALIFYVLLTYIYLTRKNVVPIFLQKYLIAA